MLSTKGYLPLYCWSFAIFYIVSCPSLLVL